ncbi:Neutral trehalase, partial [Trachipleistophora hominis]
VIISFLEKYFSEPASDIKSYNSLELAKPPKFSIGINNSRLRNLLQALHERWNMLYKETIPNANDCMSTLIELPHPFIVPGGRFRELYYWDTWFVLEGLIASGLKEASVNMLKNFIYLIDQYGFIPNGTRKYYLNRSQPPFSA